MKTNYWFALTTGRKVVLSVVIPVVAGYLLSLTKVKTDIHVNPDDHRFAWWRDAPFFDVASNQIVFAVATFVFLWLFWGDFTKTKRKDDHVA